MARKRKYRVDTEGESPALEQNPFADALEGLEAPDQPVREGKSPKPIEPEKGPRHRLDVTRETRGRGGKTVVVVSGFPETATGGELKALLKRIQAGCATGGSVKGRQIEIQGEHRERVLELLGEEGFRAVAAGG